MTQPSVGQAADGVRMVLGYALLAQGLASAVYVSGILLLAFVTGTGVTLRVAPQIPAMPAI
jgi:hypothetical protein